VAEVHKAKDGLKVKEDEGAKPLTCLGECPVPFRGTEGYSIIVCLMFKNRFLLGYIGRLGKPMGSSVSIRQTKYSGSIPRHMTQFARILFSRCGARVHASSKRVAYCKKVSSSIIYCIYMSA
jgi:hypothetical protein